MVLHGRFPYLSFPRRYRKSDYAAVRRAMEKADALELADRPMQELSGGQRQKVYLAMALAQETPAVFMDEPTTFLDVRHQMDVMRTARGLADGGKAVVLVSHDLCQALRTADRVAVHGGHAGAGVRRRRAGPGVRRAGAARARGRRLAVFLRMNRTGAGRTAGISA